MSNRAESAARLFRARAANGMATTRTENIRIVVNGEERLVPPDQTVSTLLSVLGIDSGRVAVELNRTIVRKSEWETTAVPGGSTLEIVQFVGGG